jgi:predicted permease
MHSHDLPRRYRAILALLPAHVRDEHERELRLDLAGDNERPSAGALLFDVLRAAPGAHLDVLRQDLRLAVRQVLRAPSFALVVIGTLALGLGGNLTFFTLVERVLFTPLQWQDSDRIVTINEENLPRGQREFGVSPANFRSYTQDSSLFKASAAFSVRSATLRTGEDRERVVTAAVGGGFFDVFVETPRLGRPLTSEDDVVGGDAVVVSDSFFVRHLGGDPGAVGRTIELDGLRRRVVGVMPPGFAFPRQSVEVWRPLAMREAEWELRGSRSLAAVARLREDVSVQLAAQRLSLTSASLRATYTTNEDWTVLVRDLRSEVVDNFREQLYLIWVAGALVLLVAVANVAGLFIARAVTRQREFAVRGALGARTGRMARQVFAEALVLALAGTSLGLLLASLGLSWIRLTASGVIPRLAEVSLGWRTLALSLAVALLAAAVLSALVLPAMRRADIWNALGSGRGGMARSRWRLLRAIVAGEVALACFVLIGTSLVTRSLTSLLDQPMGFDPAGVATFRVEVPFRFSNNLGLDEFLEAFPADRRRVSDGLDAMMSALTNTPGIEAAGAINRLPLSGNWWVTGVGMVGRPAEPEAREQAWIRPVTPGYLEAMRTRLVRGRFLEATDRAGAELVVVVDEVFARRVWGDADPVGVPVVLDGPPGLDTRARVVGVAEAVQMNSLDADRTGAIYVPLAQSLEGFFPNWGVDVVVRHAGIAPPTVTTLESLRALVRPYLPDAVVFNVSSMDRLVAASVSDRRFHRLILGVLSALALVLTTVGVAGALNLVVRERRKELAIRQALGADAGRVWWEVQFRGLALTITGALLGVAVTLAGARVFASLVYGISIRDPISFITAPLVLCIAAFLAAGIPATRAIRISPTSALRDS